MITPAYSLTSTERVLPRLALDFTTAVLDPRVTVTRALNTATRVNSSGLVEIVNADTARFDYNPVTLAAKGLLIEETRTNILKYSEDFSNGVWSKTAGGTGVVPVVTANYGTSPDGTQNADRVQLDSGAAGNSILSQVPGGFLSSDQTFSIYMKSLSGSVTVTMFAFGAVQNVTVTTSWQRFDYPRIFSTSTAIDARIAKRDAWNSSGMADLLVWGAQVEAGAFATSYIPNLTTGPTTRNADVVTMTGTNFSSWWTATTGGVTARALPSVVTGIRPVVQFDDNTTNNIIALRGNVANPELYIKATTDQAQIDAGTIAANTAYNLAGAWNTNSCAAAVNGGTAVTDPSATIPTVTQARLGSDGTNYLCGHLQTLRFWPQRITNAETQAFSKL